MNRRFCFRLIKIYLILAFSAFFLSFPSFLSAPEEGEEDALSVFQYETFSYAYVGEITEQEWIDFNQDGILDFFLAIKLSGSGGLMDVFILDGNKKSDPPLLHLAHIPHGKAILKEKGLYVKCFPDAFSDKAHVSFYSWGKNGIEKEDFLQNEPISVPKGPDLMENPPRDEIESIMERIADERKIPAVLLKAIAQTESGFRQFSNGLPLISRDGGYGIMQVTPSAAEIEAQVYDLTRLQFDIEYNIEKGADILLRKWGYAFFKKPIIPTINNGDPAILENWYFALWAYNGWSQSNNPNMIPYAFPTWIKTYAYQERIYEYMAAFFRISAHPLNPEDLPLTGLPDANIHFQVDATAPAAIFTKCNAPVYICRENLNLRMIDGSKIITLPKGTPLTALSSPFLQDGYYRMQVSDAAGNRGHVAIHWLYEFDRPDEISWWPQPFHACSNEKTFILTLNEPVSLKDFRRHFYLFRKEEETYCYHPMVVTPMENEKASRQFRIQVPFLPYTQKNQYVGLLLKGLSDDKNRTLKKSTAFIFDIK